MKVRVTEACAVTGVCTSIAPEVFDIGDSSASYAQVLITEVRDPGLAGRVREAAASCPACAIVIEDDAT